MTDWTVSARGVEVVVRSPDGDVFVFVIADAKQGHLSKPVQSVLQTKRTPDHSDDLVEEAKRRALDWTRSTYGVPPA